MYGFNREPISSSYNQKSSTKGDDSYSPRSYTSVSGTCSLEFDAVVTSLSGRNKEAFFTEFFILPYSLESILQNADFSISNYKEFLHLPNFGQNLAKIHFYILTPERN